MELKFITILALLPILAFSKPQFQYVTTSPYQLPQFSNLYNTYTTPYPLYGQNVRIWPYITGQTVYNPYSAWNMYGYNNAFDVNSWRNWYYSIFPYRTNYGK